MRISLRSFTRALATAILLPSLALATGPSLAEFKGKTFFGFDMELQLRYAARLMKHFDFDGLQKTLSFPVPVEVFDSHLETPGNFERLPPKLREELGRGLQLGSVLITREQPVLRSGGPLIIPGTPELPREAERPVSGAVHEGRVNIPKDVENVGLNESTRGFDIAKRGDLYVADKPLPAELRTGTANSLPQSRASDWSELHRRWRKHLRGLSPAERLQLVPLESLSDIKKAELLVRMPEFARLPTKSPESLENYLRLKPGAPEWMSELAWQIDGRKDLGGFWLELTLRTPTDDPDDGVDILMRLAREVGIEREVINPRLARSSFSLHLHASTRGAPAFDTVGKEYKKLQMLRLLELGPEYDAVLDIPGGGRQNLYDGGLEKSILKTSGFGPSVPSRTELREHFADPRTELRELYELQSLPAEEAIQKIHARISPMLTPKITDRILASPNPLILLDFENVLGKAKLSAMLKNLIIADLEYRGSSTVLKKLVSRRAVGKEEMRWLLALQHKFPAVNVLEQSLGTTTGFVMPEDSWTRLFRFLESHPNYISQELLRAFEGNAATFAAWRDRLLTALLGSIEATRNDAQRLRMIFAMKELMKEPRPPAAAAAHAMCLKLAADPSVSPAVRISALAAPLVRNSWIETSDDLALLIRDSALHSDPRVRSAAFQVAQVTRWRIAPESHLAEVLAGRASQFASGQWLRTAQHLDDSTLVAAEILARVGNAQPKARLLDVFRSDVLPAESAGDVRMRIHAGMYSRDHELRRISSEYLQAMDEAGKLSVPRGIGQCVSGKLR